MKFPLETTEVMKLLPHRFPFLLIDRVLEFQQGKHLIALKNVTVNEPFFQGHFPGLPIMPGVMQLEALAQTGAIYAKLCKLQVKDESLIVFSGIESVRFRRQVVPGDVLRLQMEFLKHKLGVWRMKGTATVDGETAVEGVFLASEVSMKVGA